jgi:hypothetical protein
MRPPDSRRIFLKVVVARHRMPLVAFLLQPHPESTVLREDIFDRYAECRTDAGEGIDHQPDKRAIA